ncbi:MAG TPA: AraC family transcriptional regulator [Polyangiaceae bacterium]
MYREYAPAAALAPYVSCFWDSTPRPAPQRVLPDGAMDVLYVLGAERSRVIGTMSRAILTSAGVSAHVIGVRFRPGAAIDLLGVSGSELLDDSALAADVWRAEGRSLDDALASAANARDALAVLSCALLERARRAAPPDRRVQRAVASLDATFGGLPIPTLARGAGVSERQLERLFTERVGYGPKLYARVARLGRAVNMMDSSQTAASFAEVAAASGYSDQAHLVREFRALSGVTPGAYARERRMSEIDNSARLSAATLNR